MSRESQIGWYSLVFSALQVVAFFFRLSSDEPVLPAFYHFLERYGPKEVGYMKPHPRLATAVKKFFSKDEVGLLT